MEEFSYEPLTMAGSKIRVLKIKPAPDGDRIECDILTCSLDDNALRFVAVSYTWGDSNDTRTIHVRDAITKMHGALDVGHNCWKALRDLRRVRLAELCWIDAICIDQTSIAERSSQVPLMGQIYSRAEKVFIAISIGDAHRRLEAFHPLEPKLSKTSRLAIRETLQEIAEHRYWGRLWILQEVFCARSLVFLSDGHCVPFNVFYEIGLRLNSCFRGETAHRGTSVYEILRLMQEGSRARRTHRRYGAQPIRSQSQIRRSLRKLVSKFGGQRCRDPHDIVYGLYAMVDDDQQGQLAVDYNSNLETFFTTTLPILHEQERPLSTVEVDFTQRLFVDTMPIPTFEDIRSGTNFSSKYWLRHVDFRVNARGGCACAHAEEFAFASHILHLNTRPWMPHFKALCKGSQMVPWNESSLSLLRFDSRPDDVKVECSQHEEDDERTWSLRIRRCDYVNLLLASARATEALVTIEMDGSRACVP